MIDCDTNKTFAGTLLLNSPLADTPQEIEAELSISPGEYLFLRFKYDAMLRRELFYGQDYIVFTTEEGSFLLYNFVRRANTNWGMFYRYSIFINNALFSSKKDYDWEALNINKISLHTENLNEWLFPRKPYSYNELLKAVKNYKPKINNINIEIKGKGSASIFDEFDYYAYSPEDGTYKLETTGFLGIKSNDFFFDKRDIHKHCREIELLLTILSGARQKRLLVKVNNDLIFYEANGIESAKVSCPSFILQLETLREKSLIKTIFTNFYTKFKYIEEAYSNFWGLLNSSHKAYLEDGYFRLFSMLDTISDKKELGTKIPLSSEQEKALSLKIRELVKSDLKEIIYKAESEEKRKEYIKIIDNISGVVGGLNNRLNYRQKMKKILNSYLTEDAQKIINISKSDLQNISIIRNKLAHGEFFPQELKTNSSIIYYKVLLLIFYLIWHDLGIDDKTIFSSIRNTLNIVKQVVNEKELDIYMGVLLFKISETEASNLKKLPSGYTLADRKPVYSNILLEKKGNKYLINLDKNTKYRKKVEKATERMIRNNGNSFKASDLAKEIYPKAQNIKEVDYAWVEDGAGFSSRIGNICIIKLK